MLKKLILTAGFATIATAASAAPLELSVGSGAWSGATTPPGVCSDIDNAGGTAQDEIRWGGDTLTTDPTLLGPLAPYLPEYLTGGDACWDTTYSNYLAPVSGYNFDPFDGTYTFPGASSPFALGTFQHLNAPILDAITSVNYTLNLNHNASTPGSPLPINLAFSHDETLNTDDSPNCCDDIVTVVVPTTSTSFDVNGEQYRFQLLGFSTTGLPGTFTNVFTSPENGTNTTQLWAEVTPVPEPATLTLLGSGLLGLGAAARRRFKKNRTIEQAKA